MDPSNASARARCGERVTPCGFAGARKGGGRLRASFKGESRVQISTRQAGGATVVDIVGDITLHNSPEVRKTLLVALHGKGAGRVIVNLKDVRYIDSSGVASLVEGLKASRDTGMRLVLVGLSPAARQVLELTRLLKLFEVHEDEQEALKS